MNAQIRTVLRRGSLFELVDPVTCVVGPLVIVVPAGYVTDFASLPSLLHWWIRPTDIRAARAAIVHDWIYHTHLLPRGLADAVFQVVLRLDGMPRRKAKLLTGAVRAFGKSAYMGGPARLVANAPALARYICKTPDIE